MTKSWKPHQIEKNVPMPTDLDGSGVGRPQKYPIAEMEVGDSIVGMNRNSMYAAAVGWARRNNKERRFTTRINFYITPGAAGKREVGPGFRMWRIK
jgi:hypothetical protein